MDASETTGDGKAMDDKRGSTDPRVGEGRHFAGESSSAASSGFPVATACDHYVAQHGSEEDYVLNRAIWDAFQAGAERGIMWGYERARKQGQR